MRGLPRGIAVLTAWLEASPGVPEDELVWSEILANVDEGPVAEIEMTMGLMKLASILLVRLEMATGTPARELLQGIAAKYPG
jgi:hypothetical protein